VRVLSGTTADSAPGTVAINTTYAVWLRYVKGTGANSIAEAYISTTETKPSVTVQVTNGTATANIEIFNVRPTATTTVGLWDKLRASSTVIGSNPA
jgi:hypothetical protein